MKTTRIAIAGTDLYVIRTTPLTLGPRRDAAHYLDHYAPLVIGILEDQHPDYRFEVRK